jgi:hypothetical protein
MVRAPLLLWGVAPLTFGACALGAPDAMAAGNDGAYGRLDGDLNLSLGAGVALAEGGPAFAATAGAMYFETAGIYVTYLDALGGDAHDVARSIGVGVTLRPLFLGRYANDLERGPAHLDLTLDSFQLTMGAFWPQPRGEAFQGEPGLEIGAGIEIPILPSASGPFLFARGALRWRDEDFVSARAHTSIVDRGAYLAFGLSWHQVVLAHLIDAGDRQLR